MRFFKTWKNEKTIAGVMIWEWRNHPDKVGGPDDTSYIPTGKPAMQVIRKYFSSPGALPRTTTTSSPADSQPTDSMPATTDTTPTTGEAAE